MKFTIRLGIPEVQERWDELDRKLLAGTLAGDERKLLKKLAKTAAFLAENPFHNRLESHEIEALTQRYGRKVFRSYLENNTPAAGRLFWVYGPAQREITIIGFSPHPEDRKSRGYDKVPLSSMPPTG